MCARTPFDHLEVETPDGLLVATPRLLTDPALAQPVDWVLVATKAYDHEATAVWLRVLFGEGTQIAILQNGVEHVERFSPYVPAGSLLPVVNNCPAERSGPGRIRLRRTVALSVPESAAGQAFLALFAHTKVVVSAIADFKSEMWRKLCVNCVIEGTLAAYRSHSADAVNSLHAERLAGRPMEVDARNGAVVRIGKKHSIATPLNKAMVALLKAVE